MDLADEMHLCWPVGARVVGHQGYQDFTGTITGDGDDGLTITGDGTTGDGVMVLPRGAVVLIAAAGYADYCADYCADYSADPGHLLTEVRMRVHGGSPRIRPTIRMRSSTARRPP